MREKYVLERYPIWFSMTVNRRDLSDVESIQFATAQYEVDAQEIAERHNAVVHKLAEMACAWDDSDPEGFRRYWYGSPPTPHSTSQEEA